MLPLPLNEERSVQMMRRILLVAINMTTALAMAASVMPIVIVAAPITRATASIGYLVFATAAIVFAGMNVVLWRWWRRRVTASE